MRREEKKKKGKKDEEEEEEEEDGEVGKARRRGPLDKKKRIPLSALVQPLAKSTTSSLTRATAKTRWIGGGDPIHSAGSNRGCVLSLRHPDQVPLLSVEGWVDSAAGQTGFYTRCLCVSSAGRDLTGCVIQ